MRSKSRRKSKRKSRVRIPIKNTGSLTSLGYKLNKNVADRRRSLSRAVKKYGYASTMRKVNTLYVFNKNKRKELAKKATSDKKWLKRSKSPK